MVAQWLDLLGRDWYILVATLGHAGFPLCTLVSPHIITSSYLTKSPEQASGLGDPADGIVIAG